MTSTNIATITISTSITITIIVINASTAVITYISPVLTMTIAKFSHVLINLSSQPPSVSQGCLFSLFIKSTHQVTKSRSLLRKEAQAAVSQRP